MGRKQRRARLEPQVPARPTRVFEQRGSLTFDSYLCCGHRWMSLEGFKGSGPDLVTHGRVQLGMGHLKPGQPPEFAEVCADCGAGCSRDERRQVVDYDRDWDFGIPKPREQEYVRSTPRPQDMPGS